MSKWSVALLVLLFVLPASAVKAQDEGRQFEITPFIGSRFGGSIDESQQGNPSVDFLKIKSSLDYGVMAGVTFWSNFEGEFMWNRQPTTLSSHNPTDDTYTFVSNMNLDMYQFDVLYQFHLPRTKIEPFAVAGLGFSHFGVPPVNGESVLGFSNRFAFNLGGGAKYFFNRHWGVRAEVRWSPSHTTTGEGEYCDPLFGCGPTTVANKAEQGQANIGIIYRFGK